MYTATVFDIIRASFVDGPGIRTSVFFKGCNLNCAWCHNPEGLSSKPQLMFYENKCRSCGKCVEVCPSKMQSCTLCGKCAEICPHDARKLCGRTISADALFAEIQKDRAFYANSGGGVTFSGGECMLQIDFLEQILQQCHAAGIHTAVDTAGCVPWESFERILPYTDLFLYDIKHMNPEIHKKYTGVDNQRILDNLRKLFAAGAHLWIRIPLIAGVNDSEAHILAVRDFLRPYHPDKIELLPYHAMGESKYDALGKKAEKFAVPDQENLNKLKMILESL